MKHTITQYVMLGVMLLLLVLIVSMFPEHGATRTASHGQTAAKVSKLSIQTRVNTMRTD